MSAFRTTERPSVKRRALSGPAARPPRLRSEETISASTPGAGNVPFPGPAPERSLHPRAGRIDTLQERELGHRKRRQIEIGFV